jgi:hypothetical protein
VSHPFRAGGRAVLPNGTTVIWSAAEGGRGRRWREAVSHDGSLGRSLLLEASPAGRVTRLEVTSESGLLTLHPDGDERELHGNVVTATGIRHLRFDWSAEHELFVDGSPAAAAVALGRFTGLLAIGETKPVPVVWVDDALEPRSGTWQVTRAALDAWHLRDLDGSGERMTRLDEHGVPVLPDAVSWPLEIDEPS